MYHIRDKMMYELFTDPISNRVYKQVLTSGHNHTKQRIERSINRAKKYMRISNKVHIESDSVIVSLLLGLDFSHVESWYERDSLIRNRMNTLTRSLGFNKSNHIGEPATFRSIYPEGTDEYYVIDERSTILTPDGDWKDYEPVKLLGHNFNDVNMTFYDSSDLISSKHAFISVNVITLAHMFNMWRIDERLSESALDVKHFVTKYVYPSMLISHIQFGLLNRFMSKYKAEPLDDSTGKLSYTDRSGLRDVDEWLMDQIGNLENRPNQFPGYLNDIELLYDETALTLTHIKPPLLTRYNQWVYTVSRLDIYHFLLIVDSDTKSSMNNKDIIPYRRELLRMVRSREIQQALPKGMFDLASLTIEAILDYK